MVIKSTIRYPDSWCHNLPTLKRSDPPSSMAVGWMKTYYAPECADLLVRVIPRINPTLSDLVQFFRQAGVQSRDLDAVSSTLNNPNVVGHSYTKQGTTLHVLSELDDVRGQIGHAARIAILKQIIDFEDFSRCWGHDEGPARALVAQTQHMWKLNACFTATNIRSHNLLEITPKSIKARQISVLAIGETIFAMLMALAIYWLYSSLTHVFLAAVIAPFLLLQTPLSTKRALKMAFCVTQEALTQPLESCLI